MTRARKVIIGTCIAALTGCGQSLEDAAISVVREKMLDPDAAQFRGVEKRGEWTVCGEVNGKNRFGAYVGFKKFHASKLGQDWSILYDSDEVDIATSLCKL